MLYSRSLLVIHFKYSSVYMFIPNSLTISSLHPSPTPSNHKFIVSVWVSFYFVSKKSYKWNQHFNKPTPTHIQERCLCASLDLFPTAVITNYYKLAGLKKKYPLTVQEARSPKRRCWQTWFLLEALRKNLSHALICSCITPISASIITCSSPQCPSSVYLCPNPLLSPW